MKFKKIVIKCFVLFIIINLLGCEAFIRKFTRKSKGPEVREEVVLAPEEYKGSGMTKEQIYRQFFVFWRSWQDELILALNFNDNHRKQVDCAQEAMKNLVNLRPYLKEDKQKQLDTYIVKMNDLKNSINNDTYCRNSIWYRQKAEKLRRDIIRDLSFPKIKPYILT